MSEQTTGVSISLHPVTITGFCSSFRAHVTFMFTVNVNYHLHRTGHKKAKHGRAKNDLPVGKPTRKHKTELVLPVVLDSLLNER